jgi:hypothetical protein
MVRQTCGTLLLFTVALLIPLHAQTTKKIALRVLDSKTGQRLTPTGYQVRINHQETAHGDWVKQGEDGTAELTLPGDAEILLIHANYQSSMETYINCDGEKQYQSPGPHWYTIEDILSKGVVTENGCVKPKDEPKLKADPKPGELVLYVRKLNWQEQMKD